MIEGDLRAVRAAPLAPQPMAPPAPDVFEPTAEEPRAAMPFSAPPPFAPQAPQAPKGSAPPPKPELPNPAAAQEHFAAAPREFHAAQQPAEPVVAPMPRAISEILEPHAAQRRALRSRRSCRPIIRWSRAHGRPADAFAVGAHRRFRKRDQRNPCRHRKSRSVRRASSPPRAAPRRPPPPRPPTRRPGARPRKAAAKDKAATGRRQSQGRGRGDNLDHHLQDPLAAGRRQRGRDRARHLQDGDDAARHRQRAADAADGKFERARARRAGSR